MGDWFRDACDADTRSCQRCSLGEVVLKYNKEYMVRDLFGMTEFKGILIGQGEDKWQEKHQRFLVFEIKDVTEDQYPFCGAILNLSNKFGDALENTIELRAVRYGDAPDHLPLSYQSENPAKTEFSRFE